MTLPAVGSECLALICLCACSLETDQPERSPQTRQQVFFSFFSSPQTQQQPIAVLSGSRKTISTSLLYSGLEQSTHYRSPEENPNATYTLFRSVKCSSKPLPNLELGEGAWLIARVSSERDSYENTTL